MRLSDLLEYTKEQKLVLVKNEDGEAIIESRNKHVRLSIEFAPFHISYFVDNELKITVNDKNLFYFEVTRTKDDAANASNESNTVAEDEAPKKERKIVDYTEGGHAIYDDGTTEIPSEMEAEVPVDGTVETPVETPTETPAAETDEKENETGYWSEYFGGKTDSKPYGPQVSDIPAIHA